MNARQILQVPAQISTGDLNYASIKLRKRRPSVHSFLAHETSIAAHDASNQVPVPI